MSRSGRELSSEYEAISLRISWGGLSICCFLIGLVSQFYLPYLPRPSWLLPGWRQFVWIPATMAMALVGLLVGLVGLRFAEKKTVAKIGVGLNGVVLVLFMAFVALASLIFQR